MEFSRLVAVRCSVRAFDSATPVTRELLMQLARTAACAPSAANRQPWRFVFVTSPEKRAELAAVYPRDWFAAAPVILAVIGVRSRAWVRQNDGFSSLATDLAIVMDHFLLAAADAGLGGCWIAAFDSAAVRRFFQLDEDEEIHGLAALGYAADNATRPKERHPADDLVSWL